MFNAQLSNTSEVEYLFDLTITEDEMIDALSGHPGVFVIGASIRETVFNIVKSLASGCSSVPVTVDFIEGACFTFDINLSRKQIANALAGLKRAGKLWRYQDEPGYFLPSAHTADYDRSIH